MLKSSAVKHPVDVDASIISIKGKARLIKIKRIVGCESRPFHPRVVFEVIKIEDAQDQS